jgi:preprotein translocase subunit YajC
MTLSFFVILGALVFIIIFRKYQKKAFALQEIQKGLYKFLNPLYMVI